MFGKKVFLTGASGFIGRNLAKQLIAQQACVTCLVRQQSNIGELEKLGCRLIVGDITDPASTLRPAVEGQDYVFHLAALTNASDKRRQMQVNVDGFENLLSACAATARPPTVVFVSSLAAVGPSSAGQPRCETDLCHPVSNYGRSKLLAEQVARAFSARLPISIVRPPIVLGAGDQEGLMLFKSIGVAGIHLIPGFRDHRFSIIHADDLIEAMIRIAESGVRIHAQSASDGIYFVSAIETPTYRELGDLVRKAVGRRLVFNFRAAKWSVWSLATINSAINYLFHGSRFFDRDKAREALAGSWTCSSQKLRNELGWSPALPLADRLQQTAQWYCQQGWLPSPKSHPSSPARTRSGQTSPPEMG